ncbi:MAG: acetyl-CoA carboxylase carboxyltransferase subunit alpha [Acidobacteria bacterium]|nr:acetyl-CoA carboxylase carboxyltransferase subunit alpha [Acidobacteriota bacterium]
MSDLERSIADLKERIEEFQALPPSQDQQAELRGMRQTLEQLRRRVDTNQQKPLDAWERTLLARHDQRPYTLDMINLIFRNFSEIHGDRRYRDDPAMICGFAMFDGKPIVVVGQQKGRNMKQRIFRNYGMPKPEGYRKAIRVMKLGDKFGLPILTLIDTPGAYPGIGAEERGQAEAIAYNLREMAKLSVPVIITVLGEGGSGGALGIGVGDRVLMLENATYSVITPESCSAILWKDQLHAREAANGLRLSAQDLLDLQLIDEIVMEPCGGAHTNHQETANILADRLRFHLAELEKTSPQERTNLRYEKFRRMGAY